MSTVQLVLEEKYRKAMAFGTYLEQHTSLADTAVGKELFRATCLYRIALHNVIQDIAKK